MSDIKYVLNALQHVAERDWGTRTVSLKGPSSNWAEHLFGEGMLKWILTDARIPEDFFRVVTNGKLHPHYEHSRSIVLGDTPTLNVMDGTKVARALQNGSSVIISALEEFCKPISRLCRSVSSEMGTRCAAFGVITPPGASGFVPHVDRTDQLVIQCLGSKEWKVFDIVEKNFRGKPLDTSEFGEPTYAEKLNQGNLLYLPQGAPHVAHTSDLLSMHITLTFETISMRKFIENAFDIICDQNDVLNASLPPFQFQNMGNFLQNLENEIRYTNENILCRALELAKKDMQMANPKATRFELTQ